VRPARAAGRAAEADPRAEGRDDERRRTRREFAHRSARRVRGCGRRALPAGGRPARADVGGAGGRGGALVGPAAAGRRVAVVTNAGGLGILCADACDAAGLSLPELAPETRAGLAAVLPAEASTANPIDLLGSATAATYEA